MGQGVAVMAAGVLALAVVGCDRNLTEGDLAVANRTDTTVEVRIISDGEPSTPLGTFPPLDADDRPWEVARTAGCSPEGFGAYGPDGQRVGYLPAIPPDSADCRFTWVITDELSYIAPSP
jgi:hypothetical protein